jgi:uncharacterized protein YprB with RNaseH-like and TPR domain
MNTACPFCKQTYEIEAEHLDQHLACSTCNRTFICSIVATPLIGVMYLDIETTASPRQTNADISSIVWWCDSEWHSWVNGKNDPEEFILFWNHSTQLVTFNGKTFDQPKIVKKFGVHPHPNHLDLMHEAKRHDLTGGLKAIGKVCNFPRPHELDTVDGSTAVKLWRDYFFNDTYAALQNLLYYNAWDVALTYYLHCHCASAQPIAIHESIPFQLEPDHLATVLPKPKKPGSPRRTVGKIAEYWEERRRNSLTTIRDAEVCITGDLARIEREDAEALIESLGGIYKNSAPRTLDFLVVGDGCGRTGKFTKVETNITKGAHTRIIDEDEFWKLIDQTQQEHAQIFPEPRAVQENRDV